jgi:hypothetical protein
MHQILPGQIVDRPRDLPASSAGSTISVDALAAARAVKLHYLDRLPSPANQAEPQKASPAAADEDR